MISTQTNKKKVPNIWFFKQFRWGNSFETNKHSKIRLHYVKKFSAMKAECTWLEIEIQLPKNCAEIHSRPLKSMSDLLTNRSYRKCHQPVINFILTLLTIPAIKHWISLLNWVNENELQWVKYLFWCKHYIVSCHQLSSQKLYRYQK